MKETLNCGRHFNASYQTLTWQRPFVQNIVNKLPSLFQGRGIVFLNQYLQLHCIGMGNVRGEL